MPNLCPNLALDWAQKFKLLGVEFDNNLETINQNYEIKLKEMRKILDCWMYRSLTVYGKITVIKTLVLSKVSHLALVLPNLSSKHIKEIESMLFNFIWDGKPDKVQREHVKMSEKNGGLGLVDIKHFWTSLKFSWLRRLGNTSAFWPKILLNSIQKITMAKTNINDLLYLSSGTIGKVLKRMKNPFWKQVLSSIIPIMQGAIYCRPEIIMTAQFWDNSNLLRNNKPVSKNVFPAWADKIRTVNEFFYPGTTAFMNREEWLQIHGIEVREEDITEIKFIIKSSFNRFGLDIEKTPAPYFPFRPIIVEIANVVPKGCSYFSKLLKHRSDSKKSLENRERKWQEELDCTLSVDFWKRAYQLTTDIKNENKMKWLQYQITRNSLYTNIKVNKFKPNISPLCTFCQNFPESVSHLFFSCEKVLLLWNSVSAWLNTHNIEFLVDKKQMLFGCHNEQSNSVTNELLLIIKYFIWLSKFGGKNLNLILCQKFLFNKLEAKKDALAFSGKSVKFDHMLVIYDILSGLPGCQAHLAAPMPMTALIAD